MINFKDATEQELEAVIRGLRLARNHRYDTTERNVASCLLGDALWAQRQLNRKPDAVNKKKEMEDATLVS